MINPIPTCYKTYFLLRDTQKQTSATYVSDCTVILSALTHSVYIRGHVLPRSNTSNFFFPCSDCFSLCLSQGGMCFGKFSTPLRLSRKTEAFWLLLQNDSLASAQLTASQTKSVLFVRRSTRIFAAFPSGWLTLYHHSALIKTHSLCIIFKFDSSWGGNKQGHAKIWVYL